MVSFWILLSWAVFLMVCLFHPLSQSCSLELSSLWCLFLNIALLNCLIYRVSFSSSFSILLSWIVFHMVSLFLILSQSCSLQMSSLWSLSLLFFILFLNLALCSCLPYGLSLFSSSSSVSIFLPCSVFLIFSLFSFSSSVFCSLELSPLWPFSLFLSLPPSSLSHHLSPSMYHVHPSHHSQSLSSFPSPRSQLNSFSMSSLSSKKTKIFLVFSGALFLTQRSSCYCLCVPPPPSLPSISPSLPIIPPSPPSLFHHSQTTAVAPSGKSPDGGVRLRSGHLTIFVTFYTHRLSVVTRRRRGVGEDGEDKERQR